MALRFLLLEVMPFDQEHKGVAKSSRRGQAHGSKFFSEFMPLLT
jgi:hypothetical protein